MNKIITLLSIPVVLAVAWGGSSWYIGKQTETLITEQINKSNELLKDSGLKQELVSFEKGIFSSKAITKLKIDDPMMEQYVGDIQFISTIQNGPIFIGGNSGIATGVSRWHSVLDKDALKPEAKQSIQKVFGDKDPFTADSTIGFNKNASYNISVTPFKLEESATDSIELGKLTLLGTSNLDTHTGDFNIQVNNLHIIDPKVEFTLPTLEAKGNMTGMVANQMLGTVDMISNQIRIKNADLPEPIVFDLAIKTDNQQNGNDFNGKLGIKATNIKGTQNSINNVSYDATLNGLNVEGIKELEQIQKELKNLESQVSWADDATDTPEGQKKQQEIMQQLSGSGEKIINTIFTKILQADKSQLNQTLSLDNAKGKINANMDFTYVAKQAPTLMEFSNYTPKEWVKMLKGKINFAADKAALPEAGAMFTSMLSSQGFLTEQGEQIKMALDLAGETATLNGAQMPMDEFLKKVMPNSEIAAEPATEGADSEMPSVPDEVPAIPEDVINKMQKQGLTPELIQELEKDKNVSEQTIQTLKDLQAMQKQVQEGKLPEEAK